METSYVIDGGELVATRDQAVYRGLPEGFAVVRVAPILLTEDAIVLLDYGKSGRPARFSNLLRVNPSGDVVWRAVPPASDCWDEWVGFTLTRSGRLSANSGSGYFCTLDLESGRIESTVFTK